MLYNLGSFHKCQGMDRGVIIITTVHIRRGKQTDPSTFSILYTVEFEFLCWCRGGWGGIQSSKPRPSWSSVLRIFLLVTWLAGTGTIIHAKPHLSPVMLREWDLNIT